MKGPTLWHASEDATIFRFEPRLPANRDAAVAEPAVWSVDDDRLAHYLLPRDCPRVCLHATQGSSDEDVARLLGTRSTRVVAIEAAWRERAEAAPLWLYELPPATFKCVDPTAGYFVSMLGVTPIRRVHLPSALKALQARGVEVRVLDTLWPLVDQVVGSTLAFSCIRLRNAQPRPGSPAA